MLNVPIKRNRPGLIYTMVFILMKMFIQNPVCDGSTANVEMTLTKYISSLLGFLTPNVSYWWCCQSSSCLN